MSSRGNKAAGAVEYIKGKLQRAFGKLTGNRTTRARGIRHQVKGGARYEVGKAEGKLDELKKSSSSEQEQK